MFLELQPQFTQMILFSLQINKYEFFIEFLFIFMGFYRYFSIFSPNILFLFPMKAKYNAGEYDFIPNVPSMMIPDLMALSEEFYSFPL